MKNLLYMAFVALLLGASFVACSDDDESSVMEVDKAVLNGARFEGEWTRVLNGDTVIGAGYMEFEMTDSASGSCVDVTVEGNSVGLAKMTSVANIVQQENTGFIFTMGTPNTFGTQNPFRGRVYFNADATDVEESMITFVKTVKQGRKSYDYLYEFHGVRVKE